MPDPIRVTRAVRRCEHWTHELPPNNSANCTWDCSDGWVDVPVDEKCPECKGRGKVQAEHPGPCTYWQMESCPDCNGSGRRLHNWATGWCVDDQYLSKGGNVAWVEGWMLDSPAPRHEQCPLILSDPSHRPEPMRWKQ